MLGEIIDVVIDRPLGSAHPNDPHCIYPLNYGFVPGVYAGDGEEQDVYVMGVTEPICRFHGRVIAVIHRLNDHEDKWVAAPEGVIFSEEEIRRATHFIEQYFESEIEVFHG
ncbi:MAG: inorganic diphosphatase [Clostridia bacterium]|nr:inorganic diphosphatase [Clostridia bacterium]